MSVKKSYKSKLAVNGQVVIPKELREALGLHPGDFITIQSEEVDGQVIQIVIQRPRVSFSSLVGLLPVADREATYNRDLQKLDDEEMT